MLEESMEAPSEVSMMEVKSRAVFITELGMRNQSQQTLRDIEEVTSADSNQNVLFKRVEDATSDAVVNGEQVSPM